MQHLSKYLSLYDICCIFFSAHAITSDIRIADTAKAAQFFLSDGVILTGSHTGQAADQTEFKGNILDSLFDGI